MAFGGRRSETIRILNIIRFLKNWAQVFAAYNWRNFLKVSYFVCQKVFLRDLYTLVLLKRILGLALQFSNTSRCFLSFPISIKTEIHNLLCLLVMCKLFSFLSYICLCLWTQVEICFFVNIPYKTNWHHCYRRTIQSIICGLAMPYSMKTVMLTHANDAYILVGQTMFDQWLPNNLKEHISRIAVRQYRLW